MNKMTDDKEPIETKDAEWTYDGGKKFPIKIKDAEWESVPKPEFTGRSALNPFIDDFRKSSFDKIIGYIWKDFLNSKSPFNTIDGKPVNIPERWLKEIHIDARKLKVCDGNCEDCW